MNFSKWENILLKKLKKPLKKERIARLFRVDADDEQFIEFFSSMILTGKLVEIKNNKFGLSGKMNMLTGILDVNPRGFGFVITEDSSEDIYVPLHNMGTAMDKDRVLVKIMSKRKREGKIVEVLERRTEKISGIVKKSGKYYYIIPDDKKILRNIFIDDEITDDIEGKKAIVEIIEWVSLKHNPIGRIIEILDYSNKVDLQGRLILLEHGFEDEFPENVINESNSIVFNSDNLKNRKDLREENIFTIDPESAKDFDDAVSVKQLDNDILEIGVHIADVSYFVREGSKLDKEAYKRATSVYLIDKTVPMLPEKLSNEICSLKPDEDRFTISCVFTVNSKGKVITSDIFPSLIRSKKRFNYKEAQNILDGTIESPFKNDLVLLNDIAKILRKEYRKQGRIDFDVPETEIILDDDKVPIDIVSKKRLNTHMLIEDLMITANMIVAKYLSKKMKHSIYRIHEKPSEDKINKMKDLLVKFGYKLKSNDPISIQHIIERSEQSNSDFLIKGIVLKSMKRAIYSIENAGHYGLGLTFYTHFTSPIRRYPDLIIHRLIWKIVLGRELAVKNIDLIAKHSSEREWAADKAEHDSVDIAKMTYIASHQSKRFEGIISSVTPFGIFIMIKDVLVEGLLRYRDMDDDFYQIQDDEMSVKGINTKKTITVGDEVLVLIKSIQPDKMTMELQIENFLKSQQ